MLSQQIAEQVEFDPSHFCNPRPMREPRVLYRSVSIGELLDIYFRGKLIGGGSLFNVFEDRRHVFFADEVSDILIGYGEAVDRQAIFALRNHPIHKYLAFAADCIDRQTDLILLELDMDGAVYDLHEVDAFKSGWANRAFERASLSARSERPKYRAMFRCLEELQRHEVALGKNYTRLLRAQEARLRGLLARSPYTSAILRTRPLAEGLLYFKEFGWSGHREREYGFRPGQLTLDHISEILLFKYHQHERTCPAAELSAIVAEILNALAADQGRSLTDEERREFVKETLEDSRSAAREALVERYGAAPRESAEFEQIR